MAASIAEVLTRHGIPVFFTPTDLIGAQQWQDEILKALERCDWFVVLLSPEAVRSMWVRRETAFALHDTRYDGHIIPLRYRTCDLGALAWLELFQMIDFSGEMANGCRDLLKIWGVGFRSDLLA